MANALRIRHLDENELKLSDACLNENIVAITQIFKECRDIFDILWDSSLFPASFHTVRDKIQQYKSTRSSDDLMTYPVGFCFPITQFCFHLLKNYPQHLKSEVSLIQYYVEQGGVFKIIWGDLRAEYFQTAIQLGDWYIDVAYDAIDRTKPKIRCARFHESGFKNIDSLQQYISIKELYHRGKIYVNNLLPQLFPYFPIFYLNSKGSLTLLDVAYINDLLRDSDVLENYLNDASALCFLPPEEMKKVHSVIQKFSNKYSYYSLLEYRESSLDELHVLRNKNRKEIDEKILKRIATNINFSLSAAF